MPEATFDHDDARRLRAEGWKLKDIAAHFDTPMQNVSKICAGIVCPVDHRAAVRRETADKRARRIEEAVALVRAGVTVTEIARRLGVNRRRLSSAIAPLVKTERKKAGAFRCALPASIKIPMWVPEHLQGLYAVTAGREDEHAAASLCRRLKASGAVACR